MPKLSIIVPVYNAEKYLDTTLNSICAQSFSDFECIIINDGSTDSSLEICNKFSKNDKRFIVVCQENAGVSSARNKGLKLAVGKYIGFVDADDYIESDMYEQLISAIEILAVDIASCGVIHESNISKIDLDKHKNNFEVYTNPIDVFYENSKVVDVLWNKVYKSGLLANICFCKDISYTEDQLFVAEALFCAKTLAVTDDVKYHYLKYDQSLSMSKGSLNFWQGHVLAMEKVYEIVKRGSKNTTVINLSFEKYVRAIFSLFRWAIQTRDKKLYFELRSKYAKDVNKFFRVSTVDIWKKIGYKVYFKNYFIASLFHYYLKPKK